MSNQSDRAAELFNQGCNCAQAVFIAAAEDGGLDPGQALKIASSFGGGMGRLREACGAVTGLFMAVGIQYGPTDPTDRDAKAQHNLLIQDLARRFREAYGSISCRDLILPEEAADPVPPAITSGVDLRRPCIEYVRFAASQLDRLKREKKQTEND
jgi:C_GCAxxG_C_C family probable redox protein